MIHAVPKGVNLKSTRVTHGFDGRIYLSAPGAWPNPYLERDKKKCSIDMARHIVELEQGVRTMKVWKEIS